MKKFLLASIRGYHKLGLWFRAAQVPGLVYTPCKFQPSCSEYAELAIHKYGPLKGSWKAIGRVTRCNPFSVGGVDYP